MIGIFYRKSRPHRPYKMYDIGPFTFGKNGLYAAYTGLSLSIATATLSNLGFAIHDNLKDYIADGKITPLGLQYILYAEALRQENCREGTSLISLANIIIDETGEEREQRVRALDLDSVDLDSLIHFHCTEA